ncbi:rho guanine nucleotide exchange factor 10 isoform X1 [Plutella xylostella]|uniref:rho guanine nucleotide exchange factor 10 isoform X1 n=2 Tax=Plutella xylostella TaxID=51655 RepID=UPI0020325E23|nr:rho guanine nucleotide exchange factor 10 isoform X1 [Plutella xylostella]
MWCVAPQKRDSIKRDRKTHKITKIKYKLVKKQKLCIIDEHRSAGGSWEEPVSTVRNAPLRRSQRLNSTLDTRSTGQLRNTLSRARELCERWRSGGGTPAPPAPPPDDEGGGRLARWFSVRRGSTHQYDMHGQDSDKMPKLPELEEDMFSCGGEVRGGRVAAPALGPPPDGLSSVQLRRRHVVAAIMHSENSYVATLQRLVNDYKKPLEESSPAILNAGKIQTLFHRLPDILQCHLHFRTALAECARTWDRDEKIGEVFLSAFSKAVVLDVYSDFINNFSVAMELAKMESKRKSALADFFKVKQISAHDRLSFFGLMVKPVQRFPQFIMFLQDLLKHTPPGHADRVALQRALTRLEALADALNERKRDAERTQAFRAALRRLTRGGVAGAGGAGTAARFGAARLLASRADRRHLLRQDDLVQLEFNQSGAISKCKPRRLLLLNDLVVCVSVGCGGEEAERLGLKWAHPVQDVEVLDTGTSPTLSRVLAQGMNRSGSLRSTNSTGTNTTWSTSTGDSLCSEMSALMHDYEAVSRMADLAAALKAPTPQLAPELFKSLLLDIQKNIQKKDDEMAWVDSCCLQLTIRGREEPITFRASEPGARLAWATELRLAQLAQHSANTPAWRLAASQAAPAHKMPLFVAATPVYTSKNLTEVRCGCFYTSSGTTRGASMRRARSLLWVCATSGASSHVAVLTHRAAKLKTLVTLDLPDTKVTSMEYAKGLRQVTTLCGDTVWLGTEDKKILIFSGMEPERQEKLAEVGAGAAVTQLRYHCGAMFAGLASGRVAVYRRNHDDSWALSEPLAVELGDRPVHCVLPVDGVVYATCARRVYAINALTAEIMRTLDLKGDGDKCIKYLAHSGVGLWTAFSDSTYVSLYHAETFEHLQNIDIAADVAKTIGARDGSRPAHVSALQAAQGLLWVGTTAGVCVTVPLPRLEGLPLLGGALAAAHHAHAGPVTFLLPLLPEREDDPAAARRHLSTARRLAAAADAPPDDRDDDKPRLERRTSEDSPGRPQRAHSALARRKKPGDVRLSKTLPKCVNLNACDVYGLYGDLMFVKDCAGEGDVGGAGGEALRRSDPELAAIPFRVSTLDRRLRMRAGRPRSLDLSSWSVDSRASSLCTSSGSEESMALRGVSRTSSGASGAASLAPVAAATPDSSSSKSSHSDHSVSRSNSANAGPERGASKSAARSLRGADYVVGAGAARRSVVTVVGGRGYVDWRQAADAADRPAPAAEPNPRDAHLVLWEMRL